MAVTAVREIATSGDMTEDEAGRRTYNAAWEVLSGDPTDSPTVILNGAQAFGGSTLPDRGDTYSFHGTTDLGSFAKGFRVSRPNPEDAPLVWHISVTWGPLEGGQTQAPLQQTNPLSHPVVAWIDWIEEQVPLEKARNVVAMSQFDPTRAADTLGPVVNAAGEEFTTPAMTTRFRPILNFRKNYATLDDVYELNEDYQDTTNSVTWFSPRFPPRTAKFQVAQSGEPQDLNGFEYYAAIIRVEINLATYDREFLNIGFKELFDAGGGTRELRNITVKDDSGNDVGISEPVQLNADGSRGDDDVAANFVAYRDLVEVPYAGIGVGG